MDELIDICIPRARQVFGAVAGENLSISVLRHSKNILITSYHVICDLCGNYHTTNTCLQAQNVNYYDELGHYNHCFDHYGANLNNSSAYGWGN